MKKGKFAAFRSRLITMGNEEPLNKLSLATIILLDLFILTVLFQGLEDRVVPPEQADILAGALRERGIPFAHLTFEGEGHGFRSAETIRRTLEAELSFYASVFGFEPADDIEPLKMENTR